VHDKKELICEVKGETLETERRVGSRLLGSKELAILEDRENAL
jgi:hypothetical protein